MGAGLTMFKILSRDSQFQRVGARLQPFKRIGLEDGLPQSALATTGDDNRIDVSGQVTECDGIAEANPTRRQRENARGACLHRHDTGRLAALDLLEL
ncbi:hypothetical protein FZC33_01630 [Labrys sp. KNU-23]|uniref:hypothetical protein n=1 Tax=Labrys sp. KNU-23 TaxID=2789216 RepID=UPI0011EEE3B3|nr:hypothetical protein [Labrys sp. KNU-23]QEN84995.1 hypothetical protein FZC33_01630 [Labrys sp. KNU-23]